MEIVPVTTATLTFNLDRAKDKYEYKVCNQSTTVLTVLDEFRNIMRTMIKYDGLPTNLSAGELSLYKDCYPNLSPQTPVSSLSGDVAVDLLRDSFFNLVKEYDVDLEIVEFDDDGRNLWE